MAGLISVIIPARDCEEVIGSCLQSLADQSLAPEEVIVVDDGSKDKTVEKIRIDFPWARIKTLEGNAGFAGACSAGLGEARGDLIAVLNADATAHADWLQELETAARLDTGIGMVASRVLLDSPENVIDSKGIRINRGGMALLRGHGQKEPAAGEDVNRVEQVFGPAGSAAMYKREMLEQVGFFEPDYFAYYEDVDLAFRARWAGWKCVLANLARAVHRHSYTMDRVGINKRYWLHKNRLRTILRNYPLSWYVSCLPHLVAYNLGGLAVAARNGELLDAMRARKDFVAGLGRDLAARRKILGTARARPSEVRRWLDLDSEPFTAGGPLP